MIGFAECWRACAQQAPLLSDDPWNQWPGCNLPGDLAHSVYLAGPSGCTCTATERQAVACCIPSISTHKRYTVPFEECMIANASSRCSPEAQRVRACSLGNHTLPPVHNELGSLKSLQSNWWKREAKKAGKSHFKCHQGVRLHSHTFGCYFSPFWIK